MGNYANQEILWNDGEGLDVADLRDMQRFARHALWDMAVGARSRVLDETDNSLSDAVLYTLGNGAIRKAATSRTVTNDRGILAQLNSSAIDNGTDAGLMVYRLAQGELATTLDAGDSQARIDLVAVKLEYVENDQADNETRTFKDRETGQPTLQNLCKRRKVRLTKQVVKGTPASSPSEPAPPSGFVRWGSVLV